MFIMMLIPTYTYKVTSTSIMVVTETLLSCNCANISSTQDNTCILKHCTTNFNISLSSRSTKSYFFNTFSLYV